MQDVEIDFSKSNGMTLVVGTNGSGKSNLLEVLSAIFSALYNKEKMFKDKLELDLNKYNKDVLKGFEILLDKLCSMVTGEEEYVEV